MRIPRQHLTRRLRSAAVAAAVVTATLSASVSSATAFTVDPIPGVPVGGMLSVSDTMITAVGETRAEAAIRVAAVTVRAMDVGGAGDQELWVGYHLQRHVDGAWQTLDVATVTSSVAPAAATTVPGWSFTKPSSGISEYRVRVTVAWIDAASRFRLGEKAIVPSAYGDAECRTNSLVMSCSVTDTGGVSF